MLYNWNSNVTLGLGRGIKYLMAVYSIIIRMVDMHISVYGLAVYLWSLRDQSAVVNEKAPFFPILFMDLITRD